MKKRVCMLLAYLPFLDIRTFRKEAKSLIKRGYEVTMVVPRQNGFLFDIDGKPFTNRFLKPTFIHEGVKFVTYNADAARPPVTLSNLKAGTYFDLSDPMIMAGVAQEADVYHAHEFLSCYYGVGIKRALKATKGKDCKLIYDSHELTPDPHAAIPSLKKKTYLQMLLSMLKEVDSVITVSEAIKSWYLTLNPRLRVEVIYNSPNLWPNYKPPNYRSKEIVVCHEGNIIPNRSGSIEKVIKITKIVSKVMDFKFKIIGGARYGTSLAIPADLKRKVIQTGWVDYQLIPKKMSDVHIGWVDLDASHSLSFMFSLPTKFFSYMNCGVPVIVNRCSEMNRIIRTFGCGLVIDKLNPTADEYAKAILHLLQNRDQLKQMSINARSAMKEHFCWERMEKRLFGVYDQLWTVNIKYFL